MSDIKLVLTDIDNTVVPHMRHDVSDGVRHAVLATERHGVRVATVSGRPYVFAKQTLDALGITGLSVLDGGATIVDVGEGAIHWKQWIDAETVRLVVEQLLDHCEDIDYTSAHDMIMTTAIDMDGVFEDAPYVFALIREEDREMIRQKLSLIDDISINLLGGTHPETGVHAPCVQVTHRLADKFHGVEALRRIINIPKEHTLAIGDGDNDLPLFENAGVKIAMGNATDQLKSKADHIVGSLEDDGFAEAMERFVMGS